jgi:hypothetical protein
VGVAVFPDRQAVLEAKCKGPLTWRCVGDAAKAQTWKALGGDERWGSVKIGLSDPTRDGDGLVTLATATTGFFDHPVVRSDLDDEAFLDWVSGLAHAVPSPRPSFATMLAAGPSILDMYAAPDAFLTGPSAAAARKPTIIYPSPVGEADVVLGAIGGAGGVVGDIVDAGTLRTAGWQPGRRTAGTADDPDVDLALQDLWRTASR